MGGLTGRRVLITRAADDQLNIAERLRARGAEPISFPCISFSPMNDRAPIDAALERFLADPPGALAIASPRAARAFFAEFDRRGLDPAAALSSLFVAAAGEGTRRSLGARGVEAEVPEIGAGAEPLARLLIDSWHANHWDPKHLLLSPDQPPAPKRVVIPQPAEATPQLAISLRKAGFTVDPIELYQTVPFAKLLPEHEPGLALLREQKIDAITFASGSAVRGFAQLLRGDLAALAAPARIVCIGESTASAARAEGLSIAAIGEHGFDSLLDALDACYSAAGEAAHPGEETKT